MRLQSHVSLTRNKAVAGRSLHAQLHRPLHLRPLLATQLLRSPQCRYQSASPERIAVLGGGIAGLSSAYFVSKEFPRAKITLFEAGKETGGWIKSRKVEVQGQDGQKGEVLFELGPRTLRNSTVTAGLIQDLNLVDQILYTKKSEPGAKNRFVYYPDRLNRLPSSVPTLAEAFALWRTGILSGAFGILTEPTRPKRPAAMTDETVGSFLSRRVDSRIANNLVSAVFHGIWAGDIHQLSVKTLMGLAWQLEGRYGSALGGFFRMQNENTTQEQETLVHPWDLEKSRAVNEEVDLEPGFADDLKACSHFTFRDGIQTLYRGLQSAVEEKGNVEIRTEAPIQSFKPLESGEIGVEVVSGPEASPSSEAFDLAISTLREPSLTPFVTVMTVNLFFPNPHLLPVQGFGYLIPQSVPFEQNPERALGVIFDSSAMDTVQGTKVTVMMGGHWWDGWESYPTEEEGLEMARSVLRRHLGITDEPTEHLANLAKDCIPQYTLGYEDRLKAFAQDTSSTFKGRLRVVGAQVNGVGVNDCISGAWNLARGLRGDGWKTRSCGLDRVIDGREWRVVPVSEMGYRRKKGVDVRAEAGMDKRGDGGI